MPYTPVHLFLFEPESLYRRRHWIDNLVFSSDVALMVKSYGGRLSNISIVWKVTRGSAQRGKYGVGTDWSEQHDHIIAEKCWKNSLIKSKRWETPVQVH